MGYKNMIVLHGSPRKNGNSKVLADQVALGVQRYGANIEMFCLHRLHLKYCQACHKCRGKTLQDCVIGDDMHFLYPKRRKADALVFAGPIYWAHVSAQMKTFMDRCFVLGRTHAFF